MKIKHLLILLLVTLAMPSMPFGISTSLVSAQTALTRTTLSTALTDTTTNIVAVASATGITASTNSAQRFIVIDDELMRVTAVNSTNLTVVRAVGGIAGPHAAASLVAYGAPGNWSATTGNASGVFLASSAANPAGACTAANNEFLPIIKVTSTGTEFFTCATIGTSTTTTGGVWNSSTIAPRKTIGVANLVLVNTSYSALITDDLIEVTSVPANTTRNVTLPCSTVPAGKTWRIFDGTGAAGTSGGGISILGQPFTLQILVGFSGTSLTSDGTNCFRID